LKINSNWGFICVAAYLLDAKVKSIDISFMLLGVDRNGFGAIQSLSTLLEIITETEDHATYFSFF
jgi:UMF1 family MFS transporter